MGIYIKARVSGPTYDTDASAFITAANIVDTYQKNAINQLVVNLKAAGIWSKMKAIYPFVGGTASSHKWNLKNPLDTNAAFRLQFNGGWSHTSEGVQPNGTNAYANTFLNANTQYTVSDNVHISVYSRTSGGTNGIDLGCYDGTNALQMSIANTSIAPQSTRVWINNITESTFSDSNALGFYIASRSGTNVTMFENNTLKTNVTNSPVNKTNGNIYIGAQNNVPGGGTGFNLPSNKQYAIATIGDSLTITEALVFNQIVEGYQYALSRNVNPVNANYYNPAYNNETNAFLYASEITDNTQKSAVNTLVNDLQTAGVWTKMKAIYPFVGGTATTHKWNLKNPLDTDAAFRLVFFGGWTHDANGVQGNGTNGYADTKFNPNTGYSVNDNAHISVYSRLNQSATDVDLGCQTGPDYLSLSIRRIDIGNNTYYGVNSSNFAIQSADPNSLGMYVANRIGTSNKGYKNNAIAISATNSATVRPNANVYLSTINSGGPNVGLYSNKQFAFASIGDGLTDTEAANFYTAVQNFQVALSRNV
jgi:hypothetical protein